MDVAARSQPRRARGSVTTAPDASSVRALDGGHGPASLILHLGKETGTRYKKVADIIATRFRVNRPHRRQFLGVSGAARAPRLYGRLGAGLTSQRSRQRADLSGDIVGGLPLTRVKSRPRLAPSTGFNRADALNIRIPIEGADTGLQAEGA
jgi:hypothetical protein